MLRYAYLDTLVFSLLADQPHLCAKVRRFLEASDLWLAVSKCHLAEWHDAHRKHAAITEFLATVRCCFVADTDRVLEAEIASYPERPAPAAIFLSELPSDFCRGPLLQGLQSAALSDGRGVMRENADRMQDVLDDRRHNFPPGPSGRYTQEQASDYSYKVVLQKLQNRAPQFHATLSEGRLADDSFPSLRLGPLVSYFRYYLGRRSPKPPSDFGDLCHVEYMPYCEVVVTERDLQETLRQARAHTSVLGGCSVENVSFIHGLDG